MVVEDNAFRGTEFKCETRSDRQQRLRQRFFVLRKLGQGTYGKVQLAIDKETNQEVAIKTIKKAKIESKEDMIRIRREIKIMYAIRHPYIIHINEVFETKERIVLVMQYASGGELYDYLGCHKTLPEEETRRLFRQIAAAIFYCHKNQICHRDLKLENILLDEKGNAKIADFGLSNIFDGHKKMSTFCGSPLYASPEIVKGTPYNGPEVDCWSLGVLLYTLIYGTMPFDGRNFKELVTQISEGNYAEPVNKSSASGLIHHLLTTDVSRRADIYDVCRSDWVNQGYDHSLLQVADGMARVAQLQHDKLIEVTKNVSAFRNDPSSQRRNSMLSKATLYDADQLLNCKTFRKSPVSKEMSWNTNYIPYTNTLNGHSHSAAVSQSHVPSATDKSISSDVVITVNHIVNAVEKMVQNYDLPLCSPFKEEVKNCNMPWQKNGMTRTAHQAESTYVIPIFEVSSVVPQRKRSKALNEFHPELAKSNQNSHFNGSLNGFESGKSHEDNEIVLTKEENITIENEVNGLSHDSLDFSPDLNPCQTNNSYNEPRASQTQVNQELLFEERASEVDTENCLRITDELCNSKISGNEQQHLQDEVPHQSANEIKELETDQCRSKKIKDDPFDFKLFSRKYSEFLFSRASRRYSMCRTRALSFEYGMFSDTTPKRPHRCRKPPGKITIPKTFDSPDSDCVTPERKQIVIFPIVSVSENKEIIQRKIEKVKKAAINIVPRRNSDVTSRARKKKYIRSHTEKLPGTEYMTDICDNCNGDCEDEEMFSTNTQDLYCDQVYDVHSSTDDNHQNEYRSELSLCGDVFSDASTREEQDPASELWQQWNSLDMILDPLQDPSSSPVVINGKSSTTSSLSKTLSISSLGDSCENIDSFPNKSYVDKDLEQRKICRDRNRFKMRRDGVEGVFKTGDCIQRPKCENGCCDLDDNVLQFNHNGKFEGDLGLYETDGKILSSKWRKNCCPNMPSFYSKVFEDDIDNIEEHSCHNRSNKCRRFSNQNIFKKSKSEECQCANTCEFTNDNFCGKELGQGPCQSDQYSLGPNLLNRRFSSFHKCAYFQPEDNFDSSQENYRYLQFLNNNGIRQSNTIQHFSKGLCKCCNESVLIYSLRNSSAPNLNKLQSTKTNQCAKRRTNRKRCKSMDDLNTSSSSRNERINLKKMCRNTKTLLTKGKFRSTKDIARGHGELFGTDYYDKTFGSLSGIESISVDSLTSKKAFSDFDIRCKQSSIRKSSLDELNISEQDARINRILSGSKNEMSQYSSKRSLTLPKNLSRKNSLLSGEKTKAQTNYNKTLQLNSLKRIQEAKIELEKREISNQKEVIEESGGSLLEALKMHGYKNVISKRLQESDTNENEITDSSYFPSVSTLRQLQPDVARLNFMDCDILPRFCTDTHSSNMLRNRLILNGLLSNQVTPRYSKLMQYKLPTLDPFLPDSLGTNEDYSYQLPQEINHVYQGPSLRSEEIANRLFLDSLSSEKSKKKLRRQRISCDIQDDYEKHYTDSLPIESTENADDMLSVNMPELKAPYQPKYADSAQFDRTTEFESSFSTDRSKPEADYNSLDRYQDLYGSSLPTSSNIDSDREESVSDRIRRKSFYSRFNHLPLSRKTKALSFDSDILNEYRTSRFSDNVTSPVENTFDQPSDRLSRDAHVRQSRSRRVHSRSKTSPSFDEILSRSSAKLKQMKSASMENQTEENEYSRDKADSEQER